MSATPIYKTFGIGFIKYLRSTKSFASRSRSIASVLILLLWLVLIIYLSTKHELWRDEVRALSIALEPDSLWQLPTTLKNEGHPILWYLILRMGFLITHTPVILKVASICIAFGGVALFFRYAPFPVWQKILFLWGVLPLYEYSVMARSFGISMLLLFLFSTLYIRRKKMPFLLAFILVALANTNAHSCILVGVLSALWFWDDVVIGRRLLNFRRTKVLVCTFAFIGIGIFGAIATIIPDQDTIVTGALSLKASQVIEALWMNIKHPGEHFENIFYGLRVPLRDVLLWILIAGLLIRIHAAASLFIGMVLLETFFTIVFPGSLRHQGIFIIFMISLYWIVRQKRPIRAKGKLIRYLHFVHKASVYIVLSAILIIHVKYAGNKIGIDISREMSSSKAFGKFLETHSEYQEAIILGEPDYSLEALPYYVPNRIYIPREGRFRNFVMFTQANKERLALGELLNIARQIRDSERKPVLIALGNFDLSRHPPFERRRWKLFTWSLEELADFRAGTVKVAEFKSAVTDENYEIYFLR